jgi:hypothetical protein
MTDNKKQDIQGQEKTHQQTQTEEIMKKQAQNPNPNLPTRDGSHQEGDPAKNAPAHQQQSSQDKPPKR